MIPPSLSEKQAEIVRLEFIKGASMAQSIYTLNADGTYGLHPALRCTIKYDRAHNIVLNGDKVANCYRMQHEDAWAMVDYDRDSDAKQYGGEVVRSLKEAKALVQTWHVYGLLADFMPHLDDANRLHVARHIAIEFPKGK